METAKKKKKKKFKIMPAVRLALQIVFFIFIPALYISAFAAVKAVAIALFTLKFSTTLLPQVLEIIAIIPITVLFGRFFCGWMCAFGTYGDFITRVAGKLFKKKWKISEKADGVLKYGKYAVLAVLIVVEWILKSTVFGLASPWDAFGMLATVGKAPAISYVLSSLTVGFIILLGITVASAFVERFFCRYLCPMGAIFAITSRLRIAKIKKPSAGCGKCKVCTNACAMGIPLYKMETVKTGECINCMKCISACPRANATFAVADSDIRPLMAGVAAVGVITGIYYTNSFTMNTAAFSSMTAGQTADTAAVSSRYKDGTYTGTGSGFRGALTTVTVTIKNGKITDITTASYGDDAPFYDRAFSTVTSEIISSQSAGVDAVSGATYSSNGIMTAVADALSRAENTSAAIETTTVPAVTEKQTTTETTTQVTTETSTKTTTEKATNAATTTKATTTKAETTTKAATTAAPAGQYTDGTYQGSGTGFRGGTTTVTVKVANGKITDITVDSYQDDYPFFSRAFPTVTAEIIGSQSANVDAVSGATYSSLGIMEAVANALS